jgi:hypothetical protein
MSLDIAYKNAGIASDSVRFGCSYDIALTTASGKTYFKHVDVEPLQGDFLYGGNLMVMDTRVLDIAKAEYFR